MIHSLCFFGWRKLRPAWIGIEVSPLTIISKQRSRQFTSLRNSKPQHTCIGYTRKLVVVSDCHALTIIKSKISATIQAFRTVSMPIFQSYFFCSRIFIIILKQLDAQNRLKHQDNARQTVSETVDSAKRTWCDERWFWSQRAVVVGWRTSSVFVCYCCQPPPSRWEDALLLPSCRRRAPSSSKRRRGERVWI